MIANFAPDIIAGVVKQMSSLYRLPLDPRRIPSFEAYMRQTTNVIL
jgi:hypothetical protein